MYQDEELFPYLKGNHTDHNPVLEILPDFMWLHKTKFSHVNMAIAKTTGGTVWFTLPYELGTGSTEPLMALRDACSYALQEYYGVKTVSVDEPKLNAEDKPTAESTVIRIYRWCNAEDYGWVAIKTKVGWRVSCDHTVVYDDEEFWRNCTLWEVIHSQEEHYRTY